MMLPAPDAAAASATAPVPANPSVPEAKAPDVNEEVPAKATDPDPAAVAFNVAVPAPAKETVPTPVAATARLPATVPAKETAPAPEADWDVEVTTGSGDGGCLCICWRRGDPRNAGCAGATPWASVATGGTNCGWVLSGADAGPSTICARGDLSNTGWSDAVMPCYTGAAAVDPKIWYSTLAM